MIEKRVSVSVVGSMKTTVTQFEILGCFTNNTNTDFKKGPKIRFIFKKRWLGMDIKI